VLFHPGGDAGEDALGDVLLEEGHASGLAGGVGDEASDGGAGGGDGDEEEGVGVAGGVEDEHDVSDAGDGEGNEGAVDDGNEEEADEAEVQEEVHEAVMRAWVSGLRRCGKREECGEWREREAHAGEYDVSWKREVAGKKFLWRGKVGPRILALWANSRFPAGMTERKARAEADPPPAAKDDKQRR
jgi:hypothetical protein